MVKEMIARPIRGRRVILDTEVTTSVATAIGETTKTITITSYGKDMAEFTITLDKHGDLMGVIQGYTNRDIIISIGDRAVVLSKSKGVAKMVSSVNALQIPLPM